MLVNKSEIHETMLALLEEKLQQARLDFALAKESRDSDTKSSAGDKYETGREMMQREMEKLSASIDTYQKQLITMQHILGPTSNEQIGLGHLVETNVETYYIAIGLGAISGSFGTIYAISAESPLGGLMLGKRVGENIELRGRNIIIKQIS